MFSSYLKFKLPSMSDTTKADCCKYLSAFTGIASIVLNCLTFGIGGTALSLISILAFGGFAYYTGKVSKANELKENNKELSKEVQNVKLAQGTENAYKI